MKYLVALLVSIMVSNTHALVLLPPVKAKSSEQLFYMLALQNSMKHELQTSYTALTNSSTTGKVELFRKMKLCELDALYKHQKAFYDLNKSFYNNDPSQFIIEINEEQTKNRKIMVDDCRLLEKQFMSN